MKDKQYRLKKGKAPLSYLLQNRHKKSRPLTYYDEKYKMPSGGTGANRALRYATNQLSVFVDEQDDNFTLGQVEFKHGHLTVPESNVLLRQFLHYHPDNGVKFEEHDPEAEVIAEVEHTEMFVKAAAKLSDMDVTQMANIISVGFDFKTKGMKPHIVKRNAYHCAQMDPAKFMELAEDDSVDDYADIFALFDNKILAYRNSKKDIYYNLPDKPKTKVTTLPFGVDSRESTIKFFMSEEGAKVFDELKEHLPK